MTINIARELIAKRLQSNCNNQGQTQDSPSAPSMSTKFSYVFIQWKSKEEPPAVLTGPASVTYSLLRPHDRKSPRRRAALF